MTDHQLELEGFSIMVLGSFNPTIFHPLWFSSNNLIRKEEATDAKIQIIHVNASIFSTEWFSLQVTNGSFSLETKDPTKSSPLRDLVAGTFHVLEHTPLSAFGMNRSRHFRMSSTDRWHAFGHHFAPKESWHAILKEPGLLKLEILGKRDNCQGIIQIRIEPSVPVAPGVFINVNEHHNLLEPKDASTADRNRFFLSVLNNQWDEFLSYASNVTNHLFSESSNPVVRSTKKRRR